MKLRFPVGWPLRVILGRTSRRVHLLAGGCFSGIVLAITAIAATDVASYRLGLDLSLSLGILALTAGIVYVVAARLERAWVAIAMIPLGWVATIASGFYPTDAGPTIECDIFRVNKGFPLPWNLTHRASALFCPTPGPLSHTSILQRT